MISELHEHLSLSLFRSDMAVQRQFLAEPKVSLSKLQLRARPFDEKNVQHFLGTPLAFNGVSHLGKRKDLALFCCDNQTLSNRRVFVLACNLEIVAFTPFQICVSRMCGYRGCNSCRSLKFCCARCKVPCFRK